MLIEFSILDLTLAIALILVCVVMAVMIRRELKDPFWIRAKQTGHLSVKTSKES